MSVQFHGMLILIRASVGYFLHIISKDGNYNRSMKIVEMLENEKMREARQFVCHEWNKKKKMNRKQKELLHHFTNTMDIIGSYYAGDYFDKNHFVDLYGTMIWKSWEKCKEHIQSERERRKFDRYQEH